MSICNELLVTNVTNMDIIMLKILNIVGARPNFMKIAPIVREMKRRENEFSAADCSHRTALRRGDVGFFFRDLGIPAPDHHLEVGSHSHTVQTAKIMMAFEPIVLAGKAGLGFGCRRC